MGTGTSWTSALAAMRADDNVGLGYCKRRKFETRNQIFADWAGHWRVGMMKFMAIIE